MRDLRNWAIYGLSVACAFLLGTVLSHGIEPALAQQQASSNYGDATVSSNGRYIAATGAVGSGMSVLWLVDTQERRVVVYGTSNLGKSIELRAARNIEWDLRLDEYHDESQYKAEDLERLSQRQKERQSQKEQKPGSGQNPDDGAKAPGSGKGD